MKSRREAIKDVAMRLAIWRGFDWHEPPNPRQQKRQAEFLMQAEQVVTQIEGDMQSFGWERQ